MSTHELSHDEAFAALDALALDALDANEREAVLAHAAWCAECKAELKELRATASHLAFSAPIAAGASAATRDKIRARLVSRATTETTTRELVRRTPPAMQPVEQRLTTRTLARVSNVLSWRRAEWVALAASILLVASIGMLAYTLKDRQNVREAYDSQLAFDRATTGRTDSLRTLVAGRDSMIASLLGRDVAIMRLTSGGARSPFALMFWDKARNAWTLSAHNMPDLKPGRTYQLWLVTANAKISAGTFDSKNGDAVVRATYALPPETLRALAVTEEPAGGVPQPTGVPIIAVSATQ